MKVIYLAHPLGAGDDREANRERAGKWMAWAVVNYHVAVVADWIVLSGQLEETAANRALGLEVDLALVRRVDELWLVGGRISDGMVLELNEARRVGVRVVDYTRLGPLPPGLGEGL